MPYGRGGYSSIIDYMKLRIIENRLKNRIENGLKGWSRNLGVDWKGTSIWGVVL